MNFTEIKNSYFFCPIVLLPKLKMFPNITHLYINFDDIIEPGQIPKTVTHIRFCNIFNSRINRNVLPNGITQIIFGNDFNQPIDIGTIPRSVKKIKFGSSFNQELSIGSIPNSVTHLIFGDNYNLPIKCGVLPDKLILLYFGNYFYEHIYPRALPPSIKFLKMNLYSIYNKNINELDNLISINSNVYSTSINPDIFTNYKINKWSYRNIICWDKDTQDFIQDIFSSRYSSILENLPRELVHYILEYPILL